MSEVRDLLQTTGFHWTWLESGEWHLNVEGIHVRYVVHNRNHFGFQYVEDGYAIVKRSHIAFATTDLETGIVTDVNQYRSEAWSSFFPELLSVLSDQDWLSLLSAEFSHGI